MESMVHSINDLGITDSPFGNNFGTQHQTICNNQFKISQKTEWNSKL